MHIYVRTGDNENTGIEFLNGKGWSEPHIEQKGFIYTPKNAPARKYEFKNEMHAHQGAWGTKNEKSLAALVLLSDELSGVPEKETVESVTWVSVGGLGLSSCDMLERYDLTDFIGSHGGEALNDEVKHIIYKYLNEGPTHVEVSITDEDRKRITYDNGEDRNIFGYMKEESPQGFSIAFDETVEHYSIPEFLRHAVFMLTDEQETLAEAILLADKLSKLEPGELVTSTLKSFMGEIREPTPAGEVLERLQHFICAYTVNDDSKIIVIDGSKTDEDSSVRRVAVTDETLKMVEFDNEPGLSGNPKKLSDFNSLRSINNIGFTVAGVSGKRWKFEPYPRSVRSTVYCKNYEDRAFAVAALALLGVADKHQYYGELQVVSDTLDINFVDVVNDILRGRDFYETLNYLKGFFNVEEVKN